MHTRFIDEHIAELAAPADLPRRFVDRPLAEQPASGLAGAQVDTTDPLALFAHGDAMRQIAQAEAASAPAELSGPELPQALALQTVPGGAFVLPSFQQEGDYRLDNIRLVNQATGQVLGSAEPSAAVLHVRKIVLASASVRALSLEELRERGITLTEKNFQAFNFAIGFALEDEIVQIEFPVVYSGNGVLNEIRKGNGNLF